MSAVPRRGGCAWGRCWLGPLRPFVFAVAYRLRVISIRGGILIDWEPPHVLENWCVPYGAEQEAELYYW
eukprot:COSAG01_NODE_8844_length_2639_cov_1.566535_1_plen_69_part_00